METKTLTNEFPEFAIQGREDKMSLEILSVKLKGPVNETLQLKVSDENGFVLYTKPLIPEPLHPNAVLESQFPEIAVNKRFIFNNFLTIGIEASAGSPFNIEVLYV